MVKQNIGELSIPKYTTDFKNGPALVTASTFSLLHVHKFNLV